MDGEYRTTVISRYSGITTLDKISIRMWENARAIIKSNHTLRTAL
jgi:hypothetical protein